MLPYCLKCIEKKDGKNTGVAKKISGKLIILSKCAVWNTKKVRFIKEKKSSRFLTSLVIKSNLGKTPLVGTLLLQRHKMKEIANRFLLAGDKFMSEMNLRQL